MKRILLFIALFGFLSMQVDAQTKKRTVYHKSYKGKRYHKHRHYRAHRLPPPPRPHLPPLPPPPPLPPRP